MIRHLVPFCVVLFLLASAICAQEKAPSTLPAVPPEIQQLKGKVVRIYHDVNLLGAGKPSGLHTGYLATLLEDAGARLVRVGANARPDETTVADVVIFGDMTPPPPVTEAEAADPFTAVKMGRARQEYRKYADSRPKLEADAAAAGSRVIPSRDVAAALGIRLSSDAQIVEALDTRARQSLTRTIPNFKAEALGLADVIDFLRDVTAVNLFVNWRALEAAGVGRNAPITLTLGQSTVAEVLDKVLPQAAASSAKGAKLGYGVDQGIVVVSTEDDVNRRIR